MPLIELDHPTQRTLGNVLRLQAQTAPDIPFVVSDQVSWTYGEVDDLADRCAVGLHRLGVTRGDTVALLAESSASLVPLTFGINRLGAIWVPTNTDYRAQWLQGTLNDSRAKVLVVDADLVELYQSVAHALSFERLIVLGEDHDGPLGTDALSFERLVAGGASLPEVGVSYKDTAAVLWTSGTTGEAKGVMQSHNAWIRAALTGAQSSQTTDDDVLYCCLPMYNSAAWIGVVYRALVAGVPFALDRRFTVQGFWDRIRHFGATQAFTLGSMHMFLWQAPERPDDAENPLRCLGAVPMPDAILEPFKKRFGIQIIQQGYGQSEIMGLISRCDDGRTRWNPGAAGTPLPGIEVRLLDDDDREVPTGEVGEFCVRPDEPHVLFNGYFNHPVATLEAMRNLWYHTGDLGRKDPDGQFHFVDRKHDYIRFKGRSVSSFSVEAALRGHRAVADVAAFGVMADTLESEAEIMVAVVLRPGAQATPEQLARHVNEQAAHFAVPRFIEILDELPYTPTGKVQKHLLRQRGVTQSTWDGRAERFEVQR